MKRINNALILLVCLFTSLSFPAEQPAADLIGKPAPKLELINADSREFDLGSYQGDVVLVVFWVPSVPDCQKALPLLDSLLERYSSKGLEIIAVNMKSDMNASQAFAREHDLSYQFAYSKSKKAALKWGITHTPTYYLIDRSGIIRHKIIAPQIFDVESLGNLIASLLQ